MFWKLITLFKKTVRLITRADFDGIACGVLLSAQEKIDRFLFVEPKAMQDGEVKVGSDDIIANLPYHPKAFLWFDHHITNQVSGFFRGKFFLAPSAARVVFDYYPPGSLTCYEALVQEADRIDSGDLDMADIFEPQGCVLLAFTIDPNSRADEPYWIKLIHLLRDQPVALAMEDAEVRARCQQTLEDFKVYHRLLLNNTRQDGTVVITDFRGINFQGKVNRFLVYSLFPEANISVKIFRDYQQKGRIGISVGKNIFNKTSNINVGELLSHYGGGGHQGAGSCRVPVEDAEDVLNKIIKALKN
ncbi:MAG TPA: exopolyphosphatase [Thermodesulfobacteriota bacterium]|nr:exopolyphosphatase [Thermodesulfobacteriota bacterium]